MIAVVFAFRARSVCANKKGRVFKIGRGLFCFLFFLLNHLAKSNFAMLESVSLHFDRNTSLKATRCSVETDLKERAFALVRALCEVIIFEKRSIVFCETNVAKLFRDGLIWSRARHGKKWKSEEQSLSLGKMSLRAD